MARVKFTTTINERLLKQAKQRAFEQDYQGANKILELALEFYFTRASEETWEKELPNGSIERLRISNDNVITENIRSRVKRRNFKASDYLEDNLRINGWVKV